ncbi:hypothetical protein Pcinc_032991 [Petrolisthes cinctipes]|uniref:Uncharacterized protein n=1 Tax=Petrolisthes cinctipes TaxID=88211 RepID=A0AAE1ET61_PETCI|nr:hypothetical protein Pcinc_032991 [Petrolisthes cinctipes]
MSYSMEIYHLAALVSASTAAITVDPEAEDYTPHSNSSSSHYNIYVPLQEYIQRKMCSLQYPLSPTPTKQHTADQDLNEAFLLLLTTYSTPEEGKKTRACSGRSKGRN